jgi:hypothetical protein
MANDVYQLHVKKKSDWGMELPDMDVAITYCDGNCKQ